MKRFRFTILIVVLLAGGVVVNAWEFLGETKLSRRQLAEFPRQIDTWKQTGVDEKFDDETMAVLKASDYLMRDYRDSDGRVLNFYVGYYDSQRQGATYHSPLNCLPGSGWVMSNPGTITIEPPGRQPFIANRYIIQNGNQKDLLIYWYQGRGRSVASEYWGKIYTVVDSMRLRRSDGAMVRITTPVGSSESRAVQAATRLAAQTSAMLPEYVPD